MIFSGNEAVVGTPLAEIFSVCVKPYNDRCEVYGLIVVKDELGDSYFYNRGTEDAQSIQKHGAISLSAPDHVISAAADFTVEINLKDKNGDNEFIKGSFTWDSENSSSYDTFLSHDFEGKLGKATMYFTILSVAVDVTFDVFFVKGCGGSSGADVYGRIIAYYGKNIGYLVSKESQFVVFDRVCDEAVTLKDGDKFPLLRDCLTVPAYSSLVFEADLHYRNSSFPEERILNGKVEFPASYIDFDKKSIEKQGGLINVYVEWKLANDVEGSPSLGMSRTENYCCRGYEILEIFSACVNRTNADGDVEFYGSLHIADGHNNMALYHYRKNDPKRILPDGTLALTGPSCVVRAENFGLTFSLRNRDLEICNGYWGLTPHENWRWNNSRMSAVVEGKDGYGIFHFAIFENAVQANVEVTLYGGGGKTIVHGSLVAYYGNYEYKSGFVKKYFQTKLLDIPEKEAIEVERTKLLPLSRYVVAVPGNSSFIVEANLICSTSVGSSHPSTRVVNRSATFSPKPYGVSFRHIEDKNVGANVKISWFGGRLSIPSTDFKRPSES